MWVRDALGLAFGATPDGRGLFRRSESHILWEAGGATALCITAPRRGRLGNQTGSFHSVPLFPEPHQPPGLTETRWIMARILLQTTIVDDPDDWNVGRFSLLADELRRAGHTR